MQGAKSTDGFRHCPWGEISKREYQKPQRSLELFLLEKALGFFFFKEFSDDEWIHVEMSLLAQLDPSASKSHFFTVSMFRSTD